MYHSYPLQVSIHDIFSVYSGAELFVLLLIPETPVRDAHNFSVNIVDTACDTDSETILRSAVQDLRAFLQEAAEQDESKPVPGVVMNNRRNSVVPFERLDKIQDILMHICHTAPPSDGFPGAGN
jgi:hypothetical protein